LLIIKQFHVFMPVEHKCGFTKPMITAGIIEISCLRAIEIEIVYRDSIRVNQTFACLSIKV
jgi:hypothetical protein